MDRTQIKLYKERLRRIQDHLQDAHFALGAKHEQAGFAEIVYHPQYTLPALNYVTPRRKTAHVPGQHIENGLHILREHRRQGRVLFMDGLYPEFFEQTLTQMGLRLEKRYPMWAYVPSDDEDDISVDLPQELSLTTVHKEQGIAIWWYVWRNAQYHILANEIEPLQVGRQAELNSDKNLIDVILYRYDTPIAVARLSLHEGSAHIMARALLQTTQVLGTQNLLLNMAVKTAREHNCDLIFLTDDDSSALNNSNVTFALAGSMVCYTDTLNNNAGEFDHEPVEQSVLLI